MKAGQKLFHLLFSYLRRCGAHVLPFTHLQ